MTSDQHCRNFDDLDRFGRHRSDAFRDAAWASSSQVASCLKLDVSSVGAWGLAGFENLDFDRRNFFYIEGSLKCD